MKYAPPFFPALLVALLLCLAPPVIAQTEVVTVQLDRAEALITASHYDSALVVLDTVFATLSPEERHVGKSGLLIRLKRTRALLRKRDYGLATHELLRLIDNSRQAREYSIQADASLRMSLIHERQNRPVESLLYLERAKKLIEDNAIHLLFSNLYNRLASYHRNFGDTTVAQRYAWQALLSAEEQQDQQQLALAHFNLSLLARNSDRERSEYHLSQAADYYHNTGSASDYLVMTLTLSDLHLRSGHMKEALEANDSAMVYAARVIDRDSTYMSRVYQVRANVLKAMGKQDSAWHYLDMSRIASVEHLRKVNSERAVEIESRYTNEKKNLLIAQQDRLLEFKRRREAWMGWTIGIVLVGIVILYYYYNRLSKANVILGQQAQTIKDRNEELAVALKEQRMLQGEVHHRVKNNLQIIISLLELQIDEMSDSLSQEALSSMAGRIYSMAAVHETLYQDGRMGMIEFTRYLSKICDHFREIASPPGGSDYALYAPECWLNLETAIPLGTILNELLTNSFKYGVVKDRPLLLTITLEFTGDRWCLIYHDNGPGFPLGHLQERAGGLGTYLLNGMSQQLQGFAETFNDNGAVTRIYFHKKNHPEADSTFGVKNPYVGALS